MYAYYSNFTAPQAKITSYQHSGDTLYLQLNVNSNVVKVEVEVNDALLAPIYINNFDNLKIYLSASVTDLSNVKIYIYDHYLNCSVLPLSSTGVGAAHRPNSPCLTQNYPNPFNPSTIISYSIPQKSFVSLEIFDDLGRKIQTLVHESQEAGEYHVQFKGDRLSSGIYFFKLQAGNFVDVKKSIIVK